jgi:hypothetical protein
MRIWLWLASCQTTFIGQSGASREIAVNGRERKTAMEASPASHADHVRFGRLPSARNSRITNGTKLLDGIDGRSASARRFKDLIAGLARDEFGGAENLSIAELGLLRQAAALMLSAEQMQAAVVRGELANADELRSGNDPRQGCF